METAARELRLTAPEIADIGVADEVLPEPPGGAHRDPEDAARTVADAIDRHLADLVALAPGELLERRYQKFRAIGAFAEPAS